MTMLFRTVRQGSEKARIWQICDELALRYGKPPQGREVVAIYVSEGGNANTGSTQYSIWRKAYFAQRNERIEDRVESRSEPGSIGFRPMTINDEGYLVIPKDMRQAMMLDEDGRVTASVVEGELRIISPLAALHAIQGRVRSLESGNTLVSEELIAERRAEASKE